MKIILVSIAVTLLLAPSGWAEEDDKALHLRWQNQPNQSIALMGPKGVIWQFNYGENLAKTFFHPVALPTGEVLTCNEPPDHPWHHALWFSWKTINGVNYWEEDRKAGLSAGVTSWQNVDIDTHDDGRARITLDLSYHLPDQLPVLTEKRTLQISPPEETGQYHIDWTSTFTAGTGEVVLDRTPLPPDPEGKPWGGYAGLSIRFAADLTERQASSTQGPALFNEHLRHRSRSPAMDYNGKLGEASVGIAIVDHPENPRYPTPWYAIRADMSYLNAALLTYEPKRIAAGEFFTLRYRLIVHAGRWNESTLEKASTEYAEAQRQ